MHFGNIPKFDRFFLESNTNIMLIQSEFVIVKESQGKSYAPASEVNPILS